MHSEGALCIQMETCIRASEDRLCAEMWVRAGPSRATTLKDPSYLRFNAVAYMPVRHPSFAAHSSQQTTLFLLTPRNALLMGRDYLQRLQGLPDSMSIEGFFRARDGGSSPSL